MSAHPIVRIDYVRMRLPTDGLDKAEAVADWSEALDGLCNMHGKSRKCYGFDMYYDYHLKRKVPYFQVWGEMADIFFRTMTPTDLRRVMRLDYRETIIGQVPDWDNLFFMLKRRNKGKVATKLNTSSKRSKEGGRDTGGDSIAMGAEGSQRRVSIYERAAEGPVWEFQCVGAAMRSVITRALARDKQVGETWNELVRLELQQEAYTYFVKYCGFDPRALDSGLPEQNGIADYTDPEVILSQLDLFWEVAPAEVREAFLEAHTTMTEHAVARAIDAELFLNESDWEEGDEGERPADVELYELETLPEPPDIYRDIETEIVDAQDEDFTSGWYTGDEPA